MLRLLIILFASFFSLSAIAQMDLYVQGNAFYAVESDEEKITLGTEAGVSLKKWDIAGLGYRSFSLERNSITPSHNVFLGGSVARRLDLKLFGFRFPFIAGMTSVNYDDASASASESYLTLSPGAQICLGKYRTQIGIGYQYFWYPDADSDVLELDSQSLSAFIRLKLF